MILQPTPVTDPLWLALSGHDGPLDPAGLPCVVQCGSLVLELLPPKDGASVLLDYRTNADWPRALSIFQDATIGISILHRQADTLLCHHLPGPLPDHWGLVRLTYAWDGPARTWSITLEDCAGAWVQRAVGTNPMPLAGADIVELCANTGLVSKHPSVQWFGVCLQTPPAAATGWIGKRTPVATTKGRIAAEELRLGDLIITRDTDPQPLRALHRVTLPNRGRYAPVLLRAPYYARQTDLLVSPGQMTLLSGAAVEYLFGEDAVLVSAGALRDGNCALTDTRRPLTDAVMLDLGITAVILADGCPLLCQLPSCQLPLCQPDTNAAPYRVLHDYEALSLQSLLGRGNQRTAA